MKVRVGNTDENSLKILKEFFGLGRIIEISKYVKYPNRKRIWLWYVDSDNAVEVLRRLIPYLQIKKREAEIAIEFHSTILKPWGQLDEGIMEKREKLYLELRSIHHPK